MGHHHHHHHHHHHNNNHYTTTPLPPPPPPPLQHPQQYIGITTITTRKMSIINTIMKNDDPPSKSNFIRFFESSTFASLMSLPWMEGAAGAMAPCIPRTVPVPIAELAELIKSLRIIAPAIW